MKKFFENPFVCFIVLCAFFLASIGSTAYLYYFKKPLFGTVNIGLVAMALPFVIDCLKNMLSHGGKKKEEEKKTKK